MPTPITRGSAEWQRTACSASVEALGQQDREVQWATQERTESQYLAQVALSMIGVQLEQVPEGDGTVLRMHPPAMQPIALTRALEHDNGGSSHRLEQTQRGVEPGRIGCLVSESGCPAILVV